MRLDKFLKNSRLIKRRTVANTACTQGRILLNGKEAKPGAVVNIGDEIEIKFANNSSNLEVISLSEHVSKEESKQMYKLK